MMHAMLLHSWTPGMLQALHILATLKYSRAGRSMLHLHRLDQLKPHAKRCLKPLDVL